ncbi:MAG: xanthine dehydrogenase small subunit [Pseudomonadota bacterium]
MSNEIVFGLGGDIHRVSDAHPTTTLLDYIRDRARLRGTKEGCNEGDCGACTVAIAEKSEDGSLDIKPVNACITLLGMVHNKTVLTVEDLSEGDALHPVQSRLVETHGSQCGFCAPGIVMSLYAHGETSEPADRATLNDWLSGNLCRCTGYRPILDAAKLARDDTVPAAVKGKIESRMGSLDALSADETPLFTGSDECFFASPETVEEAVSLLADHPDATILAGATDVGLWITKQFRPIEKVISLGRISALREISNDGDRISIGAMASYADVEELVGDLSPDLHTLWKRIGSKQIRASGTIGGNIANGSPIGDTPPVLIALGATVELVSSRGIRTLPLDELFIAYGKQDRAADEILSRIIVPKPTDALYFSCFKVSKRFDEDITAVLGAFAITLGENGIIDKARIAYGGMAATPKRATTLETVLVGKSPVDALTTVDINSVMQSDFKPISDVRASAEYRSTVSSNLVRKALMQLIDTGAETRLDTTFHKGVAHA